MNVLRNMRRLILALLFLLPVGNATAADLAEASIYRLDVPLVDQDGHPFQLATRRGRPQLVSMFYSSCPYTCPLIIDTLRMTQRALPAGDRARLDVLLVSLDPDRDTPERLKQVFGERKLDPAHWTLARTKAQNVRKLAAVLGVQYRVLSDGGINHSASLLLLDGEGRIVSQSDKMSQVDADLVAAIEHTLGTN